MSLFDIIYLAVSTPLCLVLAWFWLLNTSRKADHDQFLTIIRDCGLESAIRLRRMRSPNYWHSQDWKKYEASPTDGHQNQKN
jgi:hypothetical protein